MKIVPTFLMLVFFGVGLREQNDVTFNPLGLLFSYIGVPMVEPMSRPLGSKVPPRSILIHATSWTMNA